MADDTHTGAGTSPQASPGPDLLSGHLLGILETVGEAVHVGRLRVTDRLIVLHEGGQDECCRGTAAVMIPLEQVGYIAIFETKELLDAEAKKLGYTKATDAKRDSPEVR